MTTKQSKPENAKYVNPTIDPVVDELFARLAQALPNATHGGLVEGILLSMARVERLRAQTYPIFADINNADADRLSFASSWAGKAHPYFPHNFGYSPAPQTVAEHVQQCAEGLMNYPDGAELERAKAALTSLIA